MEEKNDIVRQTRNQVVAEIHQEKVPDRTEIQGTFMNEKNEFMEILKNGPSSDKTISEMAITGNSVFFKLGEGYQNATVIAKPYEESPKLIFVEDNNIRVEYTVEPNSSSKWIKIATENIHKYCSGSRRM